MKKKAKKLTPLQQLREDKATLYLRCKEEERMLSENWQEIKYRSGSLILSGISRMLFPKAYQKPAAQRPQGQSFITSVINNLPYYLSVAKEGITIAWPIIRPFYMKWATKKQCKCQNKEEQDSTPPQTD